MRAYDFFIGQRVGPAIILYSDLAIAPAGDPSFREINLERLAEVDEQQVLFPQLHLCSPAEVFDYFCLDEHSLWSFLFLPGAVYPSQLIDEIPRWLMPSKVQYQVTDFAAMQAPQKQPGFFAGST